MHVYLNKTLITKYNEEIKYNATQLKLCDVV